MEPEVFRPEHLIGRELGGYRLARVLGSGVMGAVFLGQRLPTTPSLVEREGALPVALPDVAAVKVLLLPWQLDADGREEFRARFEREAQTLRRLRHPHILTLLTYGADPTSGLSYLALPYMSGGTLTQLVRHHSGPLPLPLVAALLDEIAGAVDYAHALGVIHRDIKPANVLLDEQTRAYLADFSIAGVLAETAGAASLTRTGVMLGTPAYMAPEQISGERVGPAADIYALGMLTYELACGRTAYDAMSLLPLIVQKREPPPAPRTRRSDLPAGADSAILTALAPDPARRFPSAGAFARAFRDVLADRQPSPLDPVSTIAATRAASWQARAAPHEQIAMAPPAPIGKAAGSSPPVNHGSPATLPGPGPRPERPAPDRRNRWLALVAVVLLIGLAAVLAQQLASRGVFGGGAAARPTETSTAAATPTPSPSPTPSSTPAPALPTFQPGQTYTYNDIIGVSKATALTNADVNVTLVSLCLDPSAGAVVLLVSFDDYDAAKSADFAFHSVANVYLVDNAGARHPGVRADPSEVMIGPGQVGSVTVYLSPLSAGVTSVRVYFNTDHQALDTRCALLSPDHPTAGQC